MITDTTCDGVTWVCGDRDPAVLALVGFRGAVGDAPVTNWWDDGANVVTFNRGRVGFFAANNTASSTNVRVNTELRAGTYRDRVTGAHVVVNRAGMATLALGKYSAAAFTRSDRI